MKKPPAPRRPRRRQPTEAEGVTPLGREIVASLEEFRSTLKEGRPLEGRFTVRTVRIEPPAGRPGPEEVRAARESLGASQALFARFLGVGPGTVRSWEQGSRRPSGMAARFLEEIASDPERWRARFRRKFTPRDPLDPGPTPAGPVR